MKHLFFMDYSGTLSLKSSRFANNHHLRQELHRSGLAELGIHTTEDFWNELVNPSWERGSLTQRGYYGVLLDRMNFFAPETPIENEEAVRRFSRSYFNSFEIVPEWVKPLRTWIERGDRIVIATDHYAEATEAIIRSFSEIGLKAAPLQDMSDDCIVVANSADIEKWKSTKDFWIILRSFLHQEKADEVTIIDDFGSFELMDDLYSHIGHISERSMNIGNLVRAGFNEHIVRVIPFYDPAKLGNTELSEEEIRHLHSRCLHHCLKNVDERIPVL